MNKRYTGRDLDLSQLQCYPYRIVYIKSDSPTAKLMTSTGITPLGENLRKTGYAKRLNKKYGADR